jgi:hypothetical protein
MPHKPPFQVITLFSFLTDFVACLEFHQWFLQQCMVNTFLHTFSAICWWSRPHSGWYNEFSQHNLWVEKHPYSLIQYRLQQQFSINLCVGIIAIIFIGCHILLPVITGNVSTFLRKQCTLVTRRCSFTGQWTCHTCLMELHHFSSLQLDNSRTMNPTHWRGQEGPAAWPLCFLDLNWDNSMLGCTDPVIVIATFQQQVIVRQSAPSQEILNVFGS